MLGTGLYIKQIGPSDRAVSGPNSDIELECRAATGALVQEERVRNAPIDYHIDDIESQVAIGLAELLRRWTDRLALRAGQLGPAR
jgi:hypothetical protein